MELVIREGSWCRWELELAGNRMMDECQGRGAQPVLARRDDDTRGSSLTNNMNTMCLLCQPQLKSF